MNSNFKVIHVIPDVYRSELFLFHTIAHLIWQLFTISIAENEYTTVILCWKCSLVYILTTSQNRAD